MTIRSGKWTDVILSKRSAAKNLRRWFCLGYRQMANGKAVLAEVFREGDAYVALCPELNVSSFGPTPQKAKEALKEATAAFVEGCHELGTLDEVVQEAGFSKLGPSKAYKILRPSWKDSAE